MTHVDVTVIGGGPAGLAASDELERGGRRVLLVEARERLGGRAFTDRSTGFGPLELGAELLHGRDISTWQLVDRDRDRLTPVRVGPVGDTSALPPDAPPPTDDESVGDYLRRIGWPADRALPGVELLSEDSEGPDRWSARTAHDLGVFREPAPRDGEDTLLGSGYDRVLGRLLAPTRTLLGAEVRTVHRDEHEVRVDWEAADGPGTVRAPAAIVTVPLGVLQRGSIEFSPPLPAEVDGAIAALGMGDAAKLLYVLDEPVLAPGVSVTGSDDTPSFWCSGSRGTGTLVVGWVAGEAARRLLAAGPDAALDDGLAALRELVGRPSLTPVLQLLHDWAADPFARGAYSFVPPGAHGARAVLRSAVDERLLFAGEATDEAGAMTVHGAIDSGRRSARAAMDLLGHR